MTAPITAVITGASSGMGLAIARAYVERGARVVLNARDEGRLRATAEALAAPDRVAIVAGEIGRAEVGARLVDVAVARFGRVDVLVNNAGVFWPRPFTDYTEDDLDAFLRTNLRGAFLASQAAVRQFRAQGGGGAIVNVTSSISLQAVAAFPASATIAAKGGLNALTRALALELAPESIRVNAVAPGIIRTPLIGQSDADFERLGGMQPIGHVGEVGDIVDAVLHLASATYTTGVILPVDGGMATGHW
jgi:NAD(P)-dependent dehydrogenase (short-subunit alcohol dehydrogenase family)